MSAPTGLTRSFRPVQTPRHAPRNPQGAIQGGCIVGNNAEEHANDTSSTKSILIGLLIGGLTGAAAMLLLAPQSGKQTRAQIRLKSIQLLDGTTELVDNALAQVRSDTHAITAGVREKAGQLKQLGQDKIVEQLDRASAVLDAGKTAVKDA